MSSSDSSFSTIENGQHATPDAIPWRIACKEHTLGLLLLLARSRRRVTTSGSSSRGSSGGGSSGRRSSSAGAHQHVLDVLALERFGEEVGPDGLDVRDLGGLDEGVKLVGLWPQSTAVSMLLDRASEGRVEGLLR